MRERLLRLCTNWPGERRAYVILGGERSQAFALADMVYQGTVLGQIFWNVFFEDVRAAVMELDFTESVYADDLPCFCSFPNVHGGDAYIQTNLRRCQQAIHSWRERIMFTSTRQRRVKKTIIQKTRPPYGCAGWHHWQNGYCGQPLHT